MSSQPRTDALRNAYAPLILIIGVLNLLDVLGVYDLPHPMPAALWALNTVMCVRLLVSWRAERRQTGGQ